MNASEKAIARMLFLSLVHRSDGQAYEDLFTTVMTRANPEFTPIKPQGQIGDRKNDGFDRTTGVYYQVFAPEDLRLKQKEAIDKLETDFNGLIKNWTDVTPIKEFHFVLNDKYKGAFPTLETELSKIKKVHSLTEAKPFLAKDLENLLLSQPEDVILFVIGHIPSAEKIENLHFVQLNDVVGYLVKNFQPLQKTDVMMAPDFHDKIQFNKLGRTAACLLETASFQTGTLDKFFELNSEFAKEHLKRIFVRLYTEALETFKDVPEDERSDQVFFDILHRAYPNATSYAYQSAVLVLMSYFFEACDIFEKPERGV